MNALSERLRVEIIATAPSSPGAPRGAPQQSCARASKLPAGAPTGTTVTFLPDADICESLT